MKPPTEAERDAIVKDLLCSNAINHHQAYSAYVHFYISLTCPAAEGAVIQVDDSIFRSHEDILECVRCIRANSTLTRRQFEEASFRQNNSARHPEDTPDRHLEDATRTVVRLGFMLDSALKAKYSSEFSVGGYSPSSWELNEPFNDFVERAIPKQHVASVEVKWQNKALRAWKLRKRQKVKFRATDNIMEHLLYDPQTRIVRVFHHTAYLKAHLWRTQSQQIDLDVQSSLKLGSLPPQLMLETLDSFYCILFPISVDRTGRSRRMLESLIEKKGFDINSKWDEGHIRKLSEEIKYFYWGPRLEKLRDLVKNPSPQNRLISWIERHTSERNALTVAIVGLFLSAFFGFLGVLVGLAQLWVSILAWKNPV